MDVLPPELWGLIQDYVPDGEPLRTGLLALSLVEPEVALVCREPVVRLCPIAAPTDDQLVSIVCPLLERLPRAGGLATLVLNRYCQAHVGRLTFEHVNDITIHSCFTLSNVEPLKIIPHVSLLHCTALTDISALGVQQSVSIRNCAITDVSSLAHVQKVTLVDCCQLTSIRGLGRQKTLTVGGCPDVTDFSAAAAVPRLSIWNSNLTELFEAENRVLAMRDCPRLTDISKLKNVKQLSFIRCPNIATGLSSLQNVSDALIIRGLTDLSMLRARRVYLYDSPVVDISRLCHAVGVALYDCPNVVDVSPLRHAREVELARCESIRDITSLANVRMLILTDMNADAVVSDAGGTQPGARYSVVMRCNRRSDSMCTMDSSSLRNCYAVNITQHPNVTKAQFLGGRVRHLSINGE